VKWYGREREAGALQCKVCGSGSGSNTHDLCDFGEMIQVFWAMVFSSVKFDSIGPFVALS
jgi:hypothetical protein